MSTANMILKTAAQNGLYGMMTQSYGPQIRGGESAAHVTIGTAPVTMVEFSDFQCSFCRKFWALTLPSLKETYIKTGQLRLVYQHFAILGEHSVAAGQAADLLEVRALLRVHPACEHELERPGVRGFVAEERADGEVLALVVAEAGRVEEIFF